MSLTILLACNAAIIMVCDIAILVIVAMSALQSRKEGKKNDQCNTEAQPTVQSDPIMDDLMRIMTYTGADDHE